MAVIANCISVMILKGMAAGLVDLIIEKNTDYKLVIIIEDDNGVIDVAGYDAQMQIRPNPNSDTIILDFNVGNFRVTIGGIDGKITFEVESADTLAVEESSGKFDIIVTDSLGDIVRVLQGSVTFPPATTRP